MFTVTAYFFQTRQRGTASEYRFVDEHNPQTSGPFGSQASAESFARGLATQPDIARVKIHEEEE